MAKKKRTKRTEPKRTPPKAKQAIAKKLLLLFTATAFALVVGELLMRALGDVPEVKPIWVSSPNCVYQRSSNPLLSYELKPNYRSDDPDLQREHESTNSHGLRDRQRRHQKTPGVRRVILLGDSVVAGHGIRETKTISRQLEALMSADNVEVMNVAVSGYCTRAEVELLETKGLAFDPDIVVLVFTTNDFLNFNREAFALEPQHVRPAAVKYLFLYSHLFRQTALQMNLFGFGAEADPARWNRRAIGENNVVSGLRRLRELSGQHGFLTLVAVWPDFTDSGVVDDQLMPDGSGDLVVERLSWMNGIATVRLSEDFKIDFAANREGPSARIRYTTGDRMHPSPYGASVAAQALKNHLKNLEEDRLAVAKKDSARTEASEDTQAIEAAAALGQQEPNKARLYVNQGHDALVSGEPARAISYFQLALQEDSKSAEAHNNWGNALVAMGRHLDSLEHFQDALRIKPDYAEAHNNLGGALHRLRRNTEAIESYQAALRIQPDFDEAHNNWGNALKALGRNQEAVAQYQKAIQINPEHAEVHYNLGIALKALGRAQEAINHYQAALRIKPDYAEAHNNLGTAYAGKGQLVDAVRHFEHAVRLKPDFENARKNLRAVRAALQQQNIPAPS